MGDDSNEEIESEQLGRDSWLLYAFVTLALSPIVLLLASSQMTIERFWPVGLLVVYLIAAWYGRYRRHAGIMSATSAASFVWLPVAGFAAGFPLAVRQAAGGGHAGASLTFALGLVYATPVVGFYLAIHLRRHAASKDWRSIGGALVCLHVLQALVFLSLLVLSMIAN